MTSSSIVLALHLLLESWKKTKGIQFKFFINQEVIINKPGKKCTLYYLYSMKWFHQSPLDNTYTVYSIHQPNVQQINSSELSWGFICPMFIVCVTRSSLIIWNTHSNTHINTYTTSLLWHSNSPHCNFTQIRDWNHSISPKSLTAPSKPLFCTVVFGSDAAWTQFSAQPH